MNDTNPKTPATGQHTPSRILQALSRLLDASYLDTAPDTHQVERWREVAHLARQEWDSLRSRVEAQDRRIADLEAGLREAGKDLFATLINVRAALTYDAKWEGVPELLDKRVEAIRALLFPRPEVKP